MIFISRCKGNPFSLILTLLGVYFSTLIVKIPLSSACHAPYIPYLYI